MNITLFRITFVIAMLLSGIKLTAQTTDVFQYYIIHDHSGSIFKIDTNENLKKLMESLIELTGKNKDMKIATSSNFEIYSFGADTEVKDKNTIKYIVNSKSNNSIQNISGITNKDANKTQQYSNIHTALAKVIAAISSSKAKSSGVFIFTDGKLSDGDYYFDSKDPLSEEMKNPTNYYKYIIGQITQIKQLTNKPVFLIQTSYKPENPYYPGIAKLKSTDSLSVKSKELINDSTVFWLKNTAMYNPVNGDDEITKSYKDFIARANDMIINATPIININGNEKVDKSILIQEFTTVYHLLQKNPVEKELIISKVPSLKVLLELISKDSVSKTQVEDIQRLVKEIEIPDLRSAIDIAQKAVLKDVNTNAKAAFTNLMSNQVLNKAFSGAELTSTSSVSKSQGLKSFEQNVILGVTDYIIDRAKQEAIYAFMQNVKKKYIDGNPYLISLFPELTVNLNDPENYYDMSLLKETFRRDLDHLSDNIKNNPGIFKRSDELIGLVSMMKLFKNVSEKQSLEIAFNDLRDDLNSMNIDTSKTLDAFIFTSNIIGYLEKNDLSSVYKNTKELQELSSLILTLSIHPKTLGHLDYLKLKSSTKIISDIYLQYRLIKAQIDELNVMTQPTADFDGFRKMKSDAVLNILNRSADLMFSGFELFNSLKFKSDTIINTYGKLKNDIKRCIDGYFLLKNGDYTQATLLLAPVIMNAIFTKEMYASIKDYKLPVVEKIKPEADFLDDKSTWMKLLYVAGEVSDAKDAESIKKIMAKYALPVASYRIKHTSTPTLMVNAYLGAGLTCFMATQPENKIAVRPIISAPIGLEWSWKFKPAGQAYFSVFASVVDLGNIVNYRLWSSDSENKDDIIKFENIVSPGLFLIYAPWEKWPVALNLGYAFNPRRFSLSINFDLPLFAISRGLK